MNSEAEGMQVALVGRVTLFVQDPVQKVNVYAIADGKVSMNGNGPNRYCFRNKKKLLTN